MPIPDLRWQDFLDIFIIAFIVYRLLLLVVDTRAMQLLKGLFVLAAVAVVAYFLELKALTWLLSRLLGALFIAIPILFQPELRRVLEELGGGTSGGSGRSRSGQRAWLNCAGTHSPGASSGAGGPPDTGGSGGAALCVGLRPLPGSWSVPLWPGTPP